MADDHVAQLSQLALKEARLKRDSAMRVGLGGGEREARDGIDA